MKDILVLAAIDEYTGRLITDKEFKLMVNGQRADVVKQDGYLIYTGINGECAFWVFSKYYQEYDGRLRPGAMSGEVIYLRLLPGRRYIPHCHMTSLSGRYSIGQRLLLRFESSREVYKLLEYDYERQQVRMYHKKVPYPEGMRFSIETEEGRMSFRIAGQEQSHDGKSNVYHIDEPLPVSKNLYNLTAKREFEVICDEKGEFYFLVPEEFANGGSVEVEAESIAVTEKFVKGKNTNICGKV